MSLDVLNDVEANLFPRDDLLQGMHRNVASQGTYCYTSPIIYGLFLVHRSISCRRYDFMPEGLPGT